MPSFLESLSLPRTPPCRGALWLCALAVLAGCSDADGGAAGDAAMPADASAVLPASSREVGELDRDALLEGNRGLGCDDPALEARVDALLGQMTLAQKLFELHGRPNTSFDAGGDEALGIPTLLMNDGPRGVARTLSTAFPVAMARGATFDPELEKRVGEAMALELRASGRNMLLAPCINLLRHPGWGRAQETYSEDPHHMAEMAIGFISGAQRHVLATAKHLALNSIENTRFMVSANVDERTLHEVYLPHFEGAVREARVASVMSAYNRVNGTYAGEHPLLLREILKDDWGFRGFVVSDWVLGTRSTAPALEAGLDLEMPTAIFFSEESVMAALEAGDVSQATIDDAVRRILRMKLCFELDSLPSVDTDVVRSDAHLELAREVAVKSLVLLKNEGVLPLDAASTHRIAVYGALAVSEDTGDRGSSKVLARPGEVVSPLVGMRAAATGVEWLEHPTDAPSAAELDQAKSVDVAIVVVGLSHLDEGEFLPTSPEGERGGDRVELGLSAPHLALVRAVAERAPRTVVVLIGGSALLVRDFVDQVDALLMAWYGGQRGGTALGQVLFGAESPGGRLPVSFAREAGHWPSWDVTSNEVEYGYLHGYRLLDADAHEPEFPFGFGLDYTHYTYGRLRLEQARLSKDDSLVVSADVHNAGSRAGAEVVQLYVGFPEDGPTRAPRELRAFRRVPLEPGEVVTVRLRVPIATLAYHDAKLDGPVVQPGRYRVWVGGSSRDLPLEASFEVTP